MTPPPVHLTARQGRGAEPEWEGGGEVREADDRTRHPQWLPGLRGNGGADLHEVRVEELTYE
ncbi:hypothetical protein GCM10010347_11290 [Streptomyces cirratus]|uniref:Uncharacterized protein n=1 Tax=Streptomyces cirratus TaxID=68187 RepID=A0ABQ3ERH6_9ACTN|nr:hypothetical protein GCM10010347_11290 [Streptomyces cirratus]